MVYPDKIPPSPGKYDNEQTLDTFNREPPAPTTTYNLTR